MSWAQSSASVLASYALSVGASPDTGTAEVDWHVYFSVATSGQYTISGTDAAIEGHPTGYLTEQLYDESVNSRRAIASVGCPMPFPTHQLPFGTFTLEAGHEYLWVYTDQLHCSAGATPSAVAGMLALHREVPHPPGPVLQAVPEPPGMAIYGGLAGVFLVSYIWCHHRRRCFA